MAVADLYFTGFQQRGPWAESEGGPVSASAPAWGSTVRSGSQSNALALLLQNLNVAARWVRVGNLSATGVMSAMGRSTETFYTFYFRWDGTFEAFTIAAVVSSAAAEVVRLAVDASGNLTMTGTTTSATIATLSSGNWYRIDLRVTTNATSGAKVDGGTEQTVTANNVTQDYLQCGSTAVATGTPTMRFQDCVIGTTVYPASPSSPRVFIVNPASAGALAQWTTNVFSDIDDWLSGTANHDATTSIITSGTGAGDIYSTYNCEDWNNAGLYGTIQSVKVAAVMSEPTSTTTLGGVGIRSGGSNFFTTVADLGTTAWTARQKLYATDPIDSGVWTPRRLNGVEAGVLRSTSDTSSIRVTALALLVLTDGVAVNPGTPQWKRPNRYVTRRRYL